MASKGIGDGRHSHALTVHFLDLDTLGFGEGYLFLSDLTGKLGSLIIRIFIAGAVNRNLTPIELFQYRGATIPSPLDFFQV